MNKVICIVTRRPQEEHNFHPSYIPEIMLHLLKYKENNRSSMSFAEHLVMNDLMKFLENNSGLTITEVLENKEKQNEAV